MAAPQKPKENAFNKFAKKNLKGPGGALLIGFSVLEIAKAEGALKKLKAVLDSIILITVGLPLLFLNAFGSIGKGIKSVLDSTGSLEAALQRLGKIQDFGRIFTPLIGGAKQAKRHVAELLNEARIGVHSFEELAEASRGLLIQTKGLKGSAADMQALADASAATGVDVIKLSDNIGDVFAAMRAGVSTGSSFEGLAAEGVIDEATADRLRELADSGASATQVMIELDAALSKHKGGALEAAKGATAVQNAYAEAKKTLQEDFGKPFTEADIKRTEQLTEALTALRPLIQWLGKFFAILYNGFADVKVSVLKFIASLEWLQGAIKITVMAIVGLTAVFALFSGKALLAGTLALFGFTNQMLALIPATGKLAMAVTALGIAIKVAIAATIILAIVQAFIALTMAVIGFINKSNALSDAIREEEKAMRARLKLLKEQADAVQTLAQHNDALAESLKNLQEIQEKLAKLRAENDGGRTRRGRKKKGKYDEEITMLEGRERKARSQIREQANRDINSLADPRDKEYAEFMFNRDQKLKQAAYEINMERGTPEERINLMKQRGEELGSRSAAYLETAEKRHGLDKERQRILNELAVAEAEYGSVKEFKGQATDDKKRKVNELQAQLATLETTYMPEHSSEHWIGKANQLRSYLASKTEKDPEEKERLLAASGGVRGTASDLTRFEHKAAEHKAFENTAVDDGIESERLKLQTQKAEADLHYKKESLQIEKQIADLRNRGYRRSEDEYQLALKKIQALRDYENARPDKDPTRVEEINILQSELEGERQEQIRQEAQERLRDQRVLDMSKSQTSGSSEARVNLANLDKWVQNYENFSSRYDDETAQKMANELTESQIKSDSRMSASSVVGAMQSIGGGGNIGDSGLDVQKQIKAVLEDSQGYLDQIKQAIDKLGKYGVYGP
jgi:hypothetical protein